jgi:PAS domain S-box-containing protein
MPESHLDSEKRRDEADAPERRPENTPPLTGEELFRHMVESAKDYAIFATDREGRVVSWNAGAERIFGYTEAEIIGQHGSVLFTPEDRESRAPVLELEKAASEGRAEDERWHLRKDGSRFWASGMVTPLRDEAGNLRGFVKVARDMTERRQAEERRACRETHAALRADVSLALARRNASLHDLLQGCAEAMVRHLDAAFARVWTLNREENILELQASAGMYTHLDGPHSRVPVGQLKIGLIAVERRPHLTNDVQNDPRVGDKEWARREGMVAFAGYPLLVEGRLVGVMAMFARHRLTDDTIEALSSVADAVAQGIERERAEAALREREDQLRLITDAVPALISYVDSQQRYRFNNKAYEEWFGHTRTEVYGRHLRELLGEAAYEAIRPHVEAALRGERVTYEMILPYKEGGARYASAAYIPDVDERGEVRGFVAVVTDMTERKHREELRAFLAEASTTLASSLDYQATLSSVARLAVPHVADWCAVDVAGDGGEILRLAVAHVDPEKVRWAEELQQLYPHDPDAPQGVPAVIRTGKPELYAEIPDSLLEASARDEEHLRLLREVGFTSAMVVPLVARGRVFGAITFVTSESGRRYTEEDLAFAEDLGRRAGIAVDNAQLYEEARRGREEAERANRLKDEFLATLSHELRTPLTVMVGWTHLLRSGQLDRASAENALEVIERSARSQTQLIDDLLDVSRIITGKLRLDVRAVDLGSVITAAADSVRPAAEAKGIHLQTLLDPSAGAISGDAARLQQVVWNLLSNAIKFTPKGGRVQVRLERAGSQVELTVSDTGKGIKPEFLPFVFDRFRQADQSYTRAHGGLGLGLAIVRQLVEMHGGTVRVASRGEGLGAAFTVELPLLPVRVEEPGEAESAYPAAGSGVGLECPPQLEGLRVLVVDDEPDTLEMLAAVLAGCGARVVATRSAAEALELVERERPDVMVSDIGMPEEDGISLIRKVRALPEARGGRTPAAALTAYAREEDRIRALRAGFQIYVPKPVSPSELATVVANLAGRTE